MANKIPKKLRCATLLLTFFLLFSLLTPFFYSYSSTTTNLSAINAPPCICYLFGTDELGRDLLLRTTYGLRLSFFLGLSAGMIDLIIGLIVGTTSVLFGGTYALFFMRICDILQAIPYLLIVIFLMIIFPPGLLPIVLALTLTGWINIARLVRLHTLTLKQKEFVVFAALAGARKWHIVSTHFLHHLLGPMITATTLIIPHAIYTEAFLSFLGLGMRAPLASLGTMAADGLASFRYFPWRLFFPALFLSLLILLFNLLADGLHEYYRPKNRVLE